MKKLMFVAALVMGSCFAQEVTFNYDVVSVVANGGQEIPGVKTTPPYVWFPSVTLIASTAAIHIHTIDFSVQSQVTLGGLGGNNPIGSIDAHNSVYVTVTSPSGVTTEIYRWMLAFPACPVGKACQIVPSQQKFIDQTFPIGSVVVIQYNSTVDGTMQELNVNGWYE